jgi:DNA-binding transcriptional LysR family regulator
MMLAAVRAGSGLAQLPLWLVSDDLRRGQLVTVLDGMSGGELPISLLWPRTRTLPARMRAVIDAIAQNAGGFVCPAATVAA